MKKYHAELIDETGAVRATVRQANDHIEAKRVAEEYAADHWVGKWEMFQTQEMSDVAGAGSRKVWSREGTYGA